MQLGATGKRRLFRGEMIPPWGHRRGGIVRGPFNVRGEMYYRGAGDFYRGMGDPGILGVVGGLARRGVGLAARGLGLTTPVGIVGTVAAAAAPGIVKRATGGKIKIHPTKILPGGEPFIERVKRRTMNPANPKALRRAIRRLDGFTGLANRTLKGTGYAIKRTGRPKTRKK